MTFKIRKFSVRSWQLAQSCIGVSQIGVMMMSERGRRGYENRRYAVMLWAGSCSPRVTIYNLVAVVTLELRSRSSGMYCCSWTRQQVLTRLAIFNRAMINRP